MRWRGRRQSDHVDDRRGGGSRGVRLGVGGGLGGLAVLVIAMLLGVDPIGLLDGGGPSSGSGFDDDTAEFVRVVLADTEDVWSAQLPEQGAELGGSARTYDKPTMHLFSGMTNSACGSASSATGPFYCPADEDIYLDASFFEDMQRQLGAPGDFARAYVIAHEVGHHVQKLLGISDEVHRRQRGSSEVEANRLSVRLELQADFLAGVWAHHAQRMKNILESGDVEEALGAAAAIGDDRLQRRSRGTVVPESFTHGTSAQRVRWFRRGFETGDLGAGDTFRLRFDEL